MHRAARPNRSHPLSHASLLLGTVLSLGGCALEVGTPTRNDDTLCPTCVGDDEQAPRPIAPERHWIAVPQLLVRPQPCESDADCVDACRHVADGERACVSLGDEGEPCGGYAPPSYLRDCEDGLICAGFHPLLPDQPGVCRVPCVQDEDCAEGFACALSAIASVCHPLE